LPVRVSIPPVLVVNSSSGSSSAIVNTAQIPPIVPTPTKTPLKISIYSTTPPKAPNDETSDDKNRVSCFSCFFSCCHPKPKRQLYIEAPMPVISHSVTSSSSTSTDSDTSNEPSNQPIDFTASYIIKYQNLQIGNELGRGAFGVVYHGTLQHADVAIKQLQLTTMSPEVTRKFLEEARVMTNLHHPNVITFYGVCTEPNHYSMVMELAQGGSLDHLLQSKKPLSWGERWRIATDIGKGLLHLHSHEPPILHRDMKSANVLLDGQGNAKLTDFGLAKVRAETRTLSMEPTGRIAGSLLWMAPELFGMSIKPSKAADIFAYGVILWEIAARHLPYENVASPDLIPMLIKEGKREAIPAGTPPTFARLISSCWAQDPAARPIVENIVSELEAHSGEIENSVIPVSAHRCIL